MNRKRRAHPRGGALRARQGVAILSRWPTKAAEARRLIPIGEAVESHAEPAAPGNQETLGIRPTARMGEPPPSRILSGRVIRRNTVGTFSRFRRFSTM